MKRIKNIKYAIALGGASAVIAPLAMTISCSSRPSDLSQGRRTIVSFTSETSFAGSRNRVWDLSVQAKDMTSREYYDMSNTGLFRERVTQNSKVKISETGSKKETQKREEKLTFDGISKVTLEDKAGSNTNSYDNAESLLAQLKKSDNQFSTMVFEVPNGVKYVNSKGETTKYDFKAIDYFYGMMRSLYTNKEIREEGKISGIPTGIPPFEQDYISKIKNDPEFYPNGKLDTNFFNNGNVYLYNLFDFDLKGTFEANTGKNADPDKFVLKFNNKINPNVITSVLNSGSFITPVSSQKINEITRKDYTDPVNGKPGSRFAILEYGKSPIINGVADLSGMLTVSRYYWSKYSTKTTKSGGTGLILKKNINTYDKPFAKKDNNIEKYQLLIYDDKTDKDIFNSARQRSFLNSNNSESLLNTLVESNSSLMKPIKSKPKYLNVQKSSKVGLIKQGFVNPYYYLKGKDKVGDKESIFLFGNNLTKAPTDPNSDEEYFNGRGRQFRTLLNNSVNLYALSKEYNSADSKIKTRRNYQPNQQIVGGNSSDDNTFGANANRDIGVSVFSTSDSDSKRWYSNNSGDKMEALKPSENKFKKLKSLWKNLADEAIKNEAGLKAGDKFVFPLYDYRARDVEEKKSVSNTFKVLVQYLNSVTEGTGIKFREFDKNSGSKEDNIINNFKSAPFFYVGAGADYSSVSSLVQQLISAPYGFAIGMQILTDAFTKTNGKNIIKDFAKPSSVSDYSINLSNDIDITDIFDYIQNNSAKFPKLADAINSNDKSVLSSFTLEDWHNYKSRSLSDVAKKELLNEVDNLFQKYMFSISDSRNEIIKWVNLLANYNLPNKLAIGYTRYTSLANEIGSSIPISKIYTQPWMHLAQLGTNMISRYNIVDTYVDLDK